MSRTGAMGSTTKSTTRTSNLSAACLGGWMCVAATAGLIGQGGASETGAGLELADVVRATLEADPEIRRAGAQTEASRGVLVAAAAPFDTRIEAGTAGTRRPVFDPQSTATQLSQNLRLSRLFRNGVQVSSDVTLSRSLQSTVDRDRTPNDLSAGVALTIPLLRDRGGIVSRANEKASASDFRATQLSESHTAGERVLAAVTAYWDYVAAIRRLEIYRLSEARAERTEEETRALVAADERTSGDLTQISGNLSAKRVARINAEQEIVESRRPLGLAMGLTPEAIMALPPAVTVFPPLPDETATRRPVADLVRDAYGQRADLAASEQTRLSADTLLQASRNDLKPQFDVDIETGLLSRSYGLGVGRYLSPFVSDDPRPATAVGLRYSFPLLRAEARGRLAQALALVEQQRIEIEDLRRRIATAVTVAADALRRGVEAMKEADRAVTLAQATVQAEERKFQLGMSTLFDVIQAQDALTSVLLSQIASQRTYAVAIATLRFESGTLLEGEPGRYVTPIAALLAPP